MGQEMGQEMKSDFISSTRVLAISICFQCAAGPRRKINFRFKKGSVPVYLPLE